MFHSKKVNFLGLFLFCLFFQSQAESHSNAEKRITLSAIDHPAIIPMFSPPIIEAYKKIGIKINLEVTPAARALIESSSGRTDGELVRATAIESYTDSLVRLDIPLGNITVRLYCHRAVLCDTSVLDESSVTVGVISGHNAMSQVMEDRNATVVTIGDSESLQKMLELGRLKYIMGFEHDVGVRFLHSKEFNVAPELLFQQPVYHYLHKRHQDLVPLLTVALAESLETHPIKVPEGNFDID